MGDVDPMLPHYGTDFMPLGYAKGDADPMLPHYGTDFIATGMRDERRRPDATSWLTS